MKWLKMIPVVVLSLFIGACNNDEEPLSNPDKEVSDEIESSDEELESDPTNTVAD